MIAIESWASPLAKYFKFMFSLSVDDDKSLIFDDFAMNGVIQVSNCSNRVEDILTRLNKYL